MTKEHRQSERIIRVVLGIGILSLAVVGLDAHPPAPSKWNPIEHRLFSEVSKNWAGHPLASYETMLKFIRTTRTQQGLSVTATLLKGDDPIGQKPAAKQISRLNVRPHRGLPAWNYTVRPAREM